VRARSLFIIVLAVAAVGITLVIATRPDGPTNGVQASSSCPHFTPMHGMMPLLFRLGILPKPPIAATVTPTDTSTSSIIRPDRNDQIQCGKAAIKSIEDIVYATPKLSNGKSASLKMDLLIPDPARKRVVVVYVPGGGFVVAGKEGALNLRTYVAEAGFAVASVQYRTTRDGANYRDGVEDVKAAIRYLRANADKYGIDAKTVVVWGESAGGYLAAMVGLTNRDGTFESGGDLKQSSEVQGVIDDFGASDISKIAADFDGAAQHTIYSNEGLVQYIGKSPGGNALDARVATTAANPLTYIKSDAPPFILFHGNQDKMVSPSQSLILHDALVAAGVSSARYVVDGAGHGDLSFMGDTHSGLLWSTNQVMNLIVGFLDRLNDAR